MERRKVQLDNQPVDFTSFLAVWKISPHCRRNKSCAFNLEPTLPLPHQVITDGTRLADLVEPHPVTPSNSLSKARLPCACADEGDMLHFEVEDSGIGIPQDELDKIFAMYYR